MTIRLIGSKRLPCQHHKVRIDDELATTRRCGVCKRTFSITPEVAEYASQMTGLTIYRLRFDEAVSA